MLEVLVHLHHHSEQWPVSTFESRAPAILVKEVAPVIPGLCAPFQTLTNSLRVLGCHQERGGKPGISLGTHSLSGAFSEGRGVT